MEHLGQLIARPLGDESMLPGRRYYRRYDSPQELSAEILHGRQAGFYLIHEDVDPLTVPYLPIPCAIWRAQGHEPAGVIEHGESKIELGQVYRATTLFEECTALFPIIEALNKHLQDIRRCRWLIPDEPSAWMQIEEVTLDSPYFTMESVLDRSRYEARATQSGTNLDCVNSAGRNWHDEGAITAIADEIDAILVPTFRRKEIGLYMKQAALEMALAILASDDPKQCTRWVERWWLACLRGYIPVREDGDKLVCAKLEVRPEQLHEVFHYEWLRRAGCYPYFDIAFTLIESADPASSEDVTTDAEWIAALGQAVAVMHVQDDFGLTTATQRVYECLHEQIEERDREDGGWNSEVHQREAKVSAGLATTEAILHQAQDYLPTVRESVVVSGASEDTPVVIDAVRRLREDLVSGVFDVEVREPFEEEEPSES